MQMRKSKQERDVGKEGFGVWTEVGLRLEDFREIGILHLGERQRQVAKVKASSVSLGLQKSRSQVSYS